MSERDAQLWARCGATMVHSGHDHPGGWCEGEAADPPPLSIPLSTLYMGVTAHPRPWALNSLTESQAREVLEQLDRFVTHYNSTYAVRDVELILGCWPAHPGLVHELASLYGSWVVAFQSGLSSADLTSIWHDRWLPGFQHRLVKWQGATTERCRPGLHRSQWNDATEHLESAGKRPEGISLDAAAAAAVANPAHIEG